jgi:nucleobase:cation symporter-1, NCS1 family
LSQERSAPTRAAVLGKTANPFALSPGSAPAELSPVVMLVFIALDNWTINVLNLYTGGLSIANIFERTGCFWTTLIASIAGVALSAVPDVLNSYLSYATLFANFFSPIAGILVFDYLLLKRTRLDVPPARRTLPLLPRVQPGYGGVDCDRFPLLYVRRTRRS